MAFDQITRNRLARFVSDTRSLLAEEFTRQLQNDYGLDPNSGDVADLARLEHLDDARRETARLLRDTMEHYLASADTATPAKAKKARQDVLDRIVREQAFTILNRLCALRMAEARGLLIESIAKGYQSKGFQLYQRLAGTALGETGACYRLFIFSVFDEFAVDLPVLFDRFSPQGRLFPREAALLSVLQEINHPDIDPLWAEDETIGWIYQYFNSVEERRQMRAASQAPRNSRELAVRNQFFTPRYVVEFLTDNTLGRIWYEMTKGESSLKDSCRYLVRRPNEIFLSEGEVAPEQEDGGEELSQEELLKQQVYILHRPLKDPRNIKMLDPACGSMHFGLYAFDLFESIYEEAWEIEAQRGADGFVRTEGLEPLHESYSDKEDFLRDVPRLIIERNIHGIDIDPRAVQIAGLSLWLRAQRSWQLQNVKALDRPQIQRSNIVCAEPMPGEADMLEEFTEQLQPKVLGQLVKIIFEKMKLAGEAGSLLKIEEEIKDAVSTAHEAYRKYLLEQQKDSGYLPGMAPKREASLFDFAGLPEEDDFWDKAESLILECLKNYAEHASGMLFSRRRMFAKDTAQGFALIDICRKKYDVVLMNPPFGEPSQKLFNHLDSKFSDINKNLLCAFLKQCFSMLFNRGKLGAIYDRTAIVKNSYEAFRRSFLLCDNRLEAQADLGWQVLDANVEVTTSVLANDPIVRSASFYDLRPFTSEQKGSSLFQIVEGTSRGAPSQNVKFFRSSIFKRFPNAVLGYDFPSFVVHLFANLQNFEERGVQVIAGHTILSNRFFRYWWEVPLQDAFRSFSPWQRFYNGGDYCRFTSHLCDAVLYGKNGELIKEEKSTILRNPKLQQIGVLGFGKRGDFIDAHLLPKGFVSSVEGQAVVLHQDAKAFPTLALLNSHLFQAVINLYCGQHKYPGYVHLFPCPEWSNTDLVEAGFLAKMAFENKEKVESADETHPRFFHQTSLKPWDWDWCEEVSKVSQSVELAEREMNSRISIAYSLDEDAEQFLAEVSKREPPTGGWLNIDPRINQAQSIFQLALGFVFGRWDIRYATGERPIKTFTDPFESLAVCPPAMLQDENDLPLLPEAGIKLRAEGNYPIDVAWEGILVDSQVHFLDIGNKIHDALSLIWKDEFETIEEKACTQLGVSSSREWFAHPMGFFDDHLKRYSKSRRYAPIYWPLSTPSGSYTIWVYYHRLTDQTLYTCINEFIDHKDYGKLTQITEDLSRLRTKSNRSSAEEKELERLSDLELELKEFRDELLRIARFWKPNLNDGVQITAAPLWNLFQHRQWKGRLKETWEKLEAGDYDWAHLALSIWPDRVVRASHQDRSYAIAHDLEDQFWHEVEVEKVGRGGRVTTTTEWQPRDLSSADLQRIITEVKAR